jgi:hypothetical protein
MRSISVSEIKSYLRCREEHRFSYVERFRLARQAFELRFGTVIHAGLARWWETLSLGAALIALRQAAVVEGLDVYETIRAEVMLAGYDARWGDDHREIKTIWVEKSFRLQRLIEPEPYALYGKIDAGGARNGRRFVVEHKTTSDDITDGGDYMTRLAIDQQISLYACGALTLGLEPETCLYDVLKKPGIEPKKATPEASRKYTKEGRLYANQREHDETPDEFRARLVEEISEKPEAYFARVEVVRLVHEQLRALRDIDAVAQDILRTERGEPQPMTTDACRRHGRMCDFFPVCTQQTGLDSDRYVQIGGLAA